MFPCWESVWKKGFVRRGKGYQAVRLDGALNLGRVDRYNEERCETVLIWSAMCEKGMRGSRGSVLPFMHEVRRSGLYSARLLGHWGDCVDPRAMIEREIRDWKSPLTVI